MTSKEALIRLVIGFSEETCNAILSKLADKIGGLNYVINSQLANSREFVESEHPRDDAGRFSPSGTSRGEMHKREASKWDNIGHGSPVNKKIRELKAKLSKEKRLRERMRDDSEEALKSDSVVTRLQREIAEETREEKRRQRLDVESKVGSRIMSKKAKEYRDIDDEIDYMEEKYADRDSSSPTHGEVVFPKTKTGQRAKAKYDKLKARLAELDDEIEWDKVDDV